MKVILALVLFIASTSGCVSSKKRKHSGHNFYGPGAIDTPAKGKSSRLQQLKHVFGG